MLYCNDNSRCRTSDSMLCTCLLLYKTKRVLFQRALESQFVSLDNEYPATWRITKETKITRKAREMKFVGGGPSESPQEELKYGYNIQRY
jgi:hypothetical protein